MSQPHLNTSEHEEEAMCRPCSQYGELAIIQIFPQMRWHPLAPDKTFLQLKGFDKIPTDNREIHGKASPYMP